MRRSASLCAIACVLLIAGADAPPITVTREPPTATQPGVRHGARMRAAVQGLLDSLTPDQRRAVELPRDSARVRMISLFPGRRAGVRVGDLGAPAQARLQELLATVFTDAGLERVDRSFAQGTGPGDYYFVHFGRRAADETIWRLEGHHFSLTVRIDADDKVHLGAALLGANPSGPWENFADSARELYAALTAANRQTALAAEPPRRTGNAPLLAPSGRGGVPFSDLDAGELARVRALVERYRSLLRNELLDGDRPDATTEKSSDGRVVFAGEPDNPRGGLYCRVTAPGLHSEFDSREGHIHLLLRFQQHGEPAWGPATITRPGG